MTLLERLEAATGPDRELDLFIEAAAKGCDGWRIVKQADGHGEATEYWANKTGRASVCLGYLNGPKYTVIPHYTGNIDAALSWMPEGWEYELRVNSGENFCGLGDPTLHIEADAPTLPLSICIAICKARGIG